MTNNEFMWGPNYNVYTNQVSVYAGHEMNFSNADQIPDFLGFVVIGQMLFIGGVLLYGFIVRKIIISKFAERKKKRLLTLRQRRIAGEDLTDRIRALEHELRINCEC